MASLALGLAGGLIGGPAGFLIGSFIGNLLFPQKVQGPRLQDLKLHTSSYGQMTPILYGRMRVAGNVIDEQQLLSEHESDSGGKGGPEVQTFTYTASFASRLCEGPIAGIGKVWANGRVIYDYLNTAGFGDPPPITLYLGTEDQLPDPTLEVIHGVGNVPAYRGIAYVVFTDLLLTDYGNAVPSLNFEVYTAASAIPRRISTFTTAPDDSTKGPFASYDVATGIITVSEWSPGNRGGYAERQWKTDGTAVSSLAETPIPGFGILEAVIANTNIACIHGGLDGIDYWYYRGGLETTLPDGTIGSFILQITSGSPRFGGIYQVDRATGNGYIYTVNGLSDTIIRYPCSGGLPTTDFDLSAETGFAADSIKFGTSDNGKLYVHAGATIKEYSADLVLQHTWTDSDYPAGSSSVFNGTIVRYRNFFAVSDAGFSSDLLNLISIGADDALSLYPQDRGVGGAPTYGFTRGNIITLAGGLILGKDGVTSLDPLPGSAVLSDIVADISNRTQLLTSGDYDVSQLIDDVDGFLITDQQAAKDDLGQLRSVYYFDAVESDGVVKFVKRGGASVVSIPDDDLAAYGDGNSEPPIVETVRDQETDLPAILTLDYVNAAADYQTGEQISQRQTTLSKTAVDMQVSISLSDEKAKSVADANLILPWLERDKKKYFTSRKYAKYEPTDIMTIRGKDVRVIAKNEARVGVIEWDAVDSIGQVYAKGGAGAGKALGFTPSPPTPVTSPSQQVTNLALLDLPLVADADTPSGYYVGMDGKTAGWTGAALYESLDGGATYGSVFSESAPQVMGITTDALPVFLGGNVFDESSTTTVVLDGGTLSNASDTAVLGGANTAVIGAEIVQFKNATLTATNTYVLSGFLRGRRGTERAMAHAVGERFVLLPTARVAQSLSDLGVTRQFKPVSFGSTVGNSTAQPFANSGSSLRPYAPVLLGGGVDASGNVTLNWTLRTRTGGAWLSFADIVQADSTDCVVQIWNADYTHCARIIEVTGQTTTYSSANQVTDFGANQQTIYFTVGQKGSIGLGYQSRGAATGAGSSDVDVLSPISPYESPTSGSSSPPPPPDSLSLSMGWANVRKLSSSVGTFNCSNILVCSFTTPASTANGAIGWIAAVEWIDPAVGRVATLSTAPGDFSGSALSRVVSIEPTCFFSVGTNRDGYPELSTSTTYYFNVKNDNGFGACTCLSGSCGVAVELNKPTGL